MRIRDFKSTDQAEINRLQQAFMLEFFPEFANDPGQFEWNADIYAIDEYYIKPGGKFWVTETSDRITGFGGLHQLDSSTAEIKRVRIDALHRGKGLGKSIVKQIENYCACNAISKILVDTDDRFDVAKAMYTAMGYQIYRSETETKNGLVYTDNFYVKTLTE